MLTTNRLYSISIIIPTYNSEKFLDECLYSIFQQDYPKELIEILIIDGGSKDNTIEVAKKYTNKIFSNPLKTGEAGKAIGLKNAKNELIALIDSDNVLPEKNWLKNMVIPFMDKEIIGSEPWSFSYRKEDGFIDRYCALLGMNDPLCFFLGNYDRLCTLTGKWTNLTLEQKDHGTWISINIKPPNIPTIGANGTIIRKKVLLESNLIGDYLFDIDIISYLAQKEPVFFAKIKNSIIHLYCGNSLLKFIRKQKRRIKDYLYYKKLGLRNYPWLFQNKLGLLKFIIWNILFIPLIVQSLRGYCIKKDFAWFFHPLACFLTFIIYSFIKITSFLKINKQSRDKWEQ